MKRFQEIIHILLEEELGFVIDRLNLLGHAPLLKRVLNPDRSVPPPERVRETLERLGPTFIKFGQIMAQRPDMLPPEYTQELQKLEDSVPSFDSSVAKEIVTEELGDIDEVFDEFHEEPLAAASIAQVHRATLKNGDDVVVKIRRPGIKEQIEEDLDILLFLATRGEKYSKTLQHWQVHETVKEFADWTQDELNLKREGRNAQTMQRNMQDEERVKIPDVYPEHTTEKVLVMEYVEGVKCTNTEALKELDVSEKDLAHTAIRAGLKQTVRDGFFHADPHPSNFLINEDGEIVYLDFGMIGKFSLSTRRNLGLLFLHAGNEDIEAAVDTVRRMAVVEPDANLEALKADIEQSVLRVRNSTLADQSVTGALMDISVTASQRGVHMPPSLTIMGKSMLTMEGIGLAIYPDFQISDEFQTTVRDILWEMNDPKQMLQTFMIDLVENRDLFVRMPSQIHKIVDGLDSSGNTLIDNATKTEMDTLLIGALVLSSSILFLETLPAQSLLYIGAAELVIAVLLLLRKN